MPNEIWNEAEFSRLEEYGFVSDYVHFRREGDNVYVDPAFSVEYLLESGFYPKGTKARYLGRNGYDAQREHIEKLGIKEGDILTVDKCEVGSSSSYYTFKELAGRFNTVMFEKVEELCGVQKPSEDGRIIG